MAQDIYDGTRKSKQNAELAGLKKINDPLGLEVVARLRQIKAFNAATNADDTACPIHVEPLSISSKMLTYSSLSDS